MQGEVKLWRAVPAALYACFALDALNLACMVLVERYHYWFSGRLFLAWDGIAVASIVLAIYGAFELAGRFTGLARAGAIIAVIANALMLVFMVGFATYFDLRDQVDPDSWLLVIDRYAWIGLFVIEAVGWTLAAWRVPEAAIPCGIVVVVTELPNQLWAHLLGDHMGPKIDLALRGVHWVALAILVLFAARGATQPAPRRAAAGLRRAGASLTLRVVAAVVGTGTLLLAGLGSGGDAGVLRFGVLAGAGIGVVALAMFATGALDAARSGLRELPGWSLVIAATAALWAAGVAVRQLPALYIALYRWGSDRRPEMLDASQALPVVTLAVTTIALIAIVLAIALFAARRADSALRAETANRGTIAIVMWSASAGLTVWALPSPESAASAIGVALGAVFAMLWSLLLVASLCRKAAAALEHAPVLPGARVV